MPYKQFSTPAEIYAEQGFKNEQPVSLVNYRGLYGFYGFPEGTELACCVQRPSGTLCRTAHRKGWVVRVADNDALALSIIGDDCATTKFGANSQITNDIKIATNQLSEAERLKRLHEQVGDRDEMLRWCVDARRVLADHKTKLEVLAEGLGEAWPRLVSMSRSGNGGIQVLGATPAKFDKDGEKVADARQTLIAIGRVRNVEACNPGRSGHIGAALYQLEAQCRRPDEELLKLKGDKLRGAIAIMAEYPRLRLDLEALVKEMGAFEANDFTMLCYTVKEHADRVKVVRFARNRQGKATSKDSAKDWIFANDNQLKERYGVARLVIG